MINVIIAKVNQNVVSIEANGHSGYAEEGSDIVCSAVSTLLETLINGLLEVAKIDTKYDIDESIPRLFVSLPENITGEQMRDAQMLMKTAVLGLKSVRNEYQKFIKIKEK